MFEKWFGHKMPEPQPIPRKVVIPSKIDTPTVDPGVRSQWDPLALKKANRQMTDLVGFYYVRDHIKPVAVPYFADIHTVYCVVIVAEVEAQKRQNRVPSIKMFDIGSSRHWGAYTLTAEHSRVISKENVSVVSLARKGEDMFCEKLMYVTEKVVAQHRHTHHFADLGYYLYLIDHLNQVPNVMKNCKGNIFAGTIVMIGSVPHVLVATWNGAGFDTELISLRNGLEDVAQFVLIKK